MTMSRIRTITMAIVAAIRSPTVFNDIGVAYLRRRRVISYDKPTYDSSMWQMRQTCKCFSKPVWVIAPRARLTTQQTVSLIWHVVGIDVYSASPYNVNNQRVNVSAMSVNLKPVMNMYNGNSSPYDINVMALLRRNDMYCPMARRLLCRDRRRVY